MGNSCDFHHRAAAELSSELLKNGVQSPYLAIVNRQAVIMLRAAEMLGFVPTARPRLVGSKPATIDGEVQSLDEFLSVPLDLPSMHNYNHPSKRRKPN